MDRTTPEEFIGYFLNDSNIDDKIKIELLAAISDYDVEITDEDVIFLLKEYARKSDGDLSWYAAYALATSNPEEAKDFYDRCLEIGLVDKKYNMMYSGLEAGIEHDDS